MKIIPVLLLCVLWFTSAHALGGEMKIKTGKWEFRSTSSMAGGPGMPREHVNQECIKTAKMSPELLMKDMANTCELLDAKGDSQSMAWKVKCAAPGGEMTGEGNVRSAGDTLKGKMDMKMSFNGQQMDMSMDWDGRYLGPCD